MSPTSARRSVWVGMGFALLSAIGFSWKAILAKLAYRTGVDATTVVGLRLAFSLPAYAALAWFGGRQSGVPLTRRDVGVVLVLGLVGYYVATWLDFFGLSRISAGLERLILFLHPSIVVLLAAFLHGRRITRRDGLAMALGYGGIVFVFLGDVDGAPRDAAAWTGVLAVFGSSIAYAAYLAFSEKVVSRLGSTRFTGLAMTCASVVGVAQYLAVARTVPPASAVVLCATMALVATVIPTWLLNESIERIGAGRAALCGMVGPVITVALEGLLLGEETSAADGFGTALVIVGVLLLTRSNPTQVAATQPASARR